jgi:cytochrome c553
MTMFGRWGSAFLAAAVLAAPGAVSAQSAAVTGDAARGARLGYTCLGCHGIPNYKNTYPNYRVPKLAGQSPSYIVIALQAYRNQERGHATMHAQAVSMSDQDMADVAAYLAGTPVQSKPDARPVGTAPEAAAVCVSCHGNDGVGITPEYPTLAGQHEDYLQRALLDYKRGGRKNAVMAGFVGALSEADIKALAAYYAAQPGLETSRKRVTRLSAR